MITHFVLTASLLLGLTLGAADTACTESGRDYRDGAAVLQVIHNRARSGWARYDGSLAGALWSPAQHAHGCGWPLTLGHLRLGIQFVLDDLPVEPWARRALWYCSDRDRPGTCEARGAEIVGEIAHRFYAPTRRFAFVAPDPD